MSDDIIFYKVKQEYKGFVLDFINNYNHQRISDIDKLYSTDHIFKKLRDGGVLGVWFDPIRSSDFPKINGSYPIVEDETLKYGNMGLPFDLIADLCDDILAFNDPPSNLSGSYYSDNSPLVSSITFNNGIVLKLDDIKTIYRIL